MRLLALSVLALAPACGSNTPGGGGGPDASNLAVDAQNNTTHMEPWKVGSDWTYQITDPTTGTMVTKHTVVEAYEDVGGAHAGTLAFRVRAGKLAGDTVSWEGYVGDLGVRYAQKDYDTTNALLDDLSEDPYRLKVDDTAAHIVANAAYSETYTETPAGGTAKSHTLNWTVVNPAESLTVPAGTYTTLHLHRVDPATGKFKDYWFTPGVGKIKETGGNETEELASYTP